MGGYGSSRWGGYRRMHTVEESLSLDIPKLVRGGLIGGPERSGNLVWRVLGGIRDGGQKANVDYRWTPDDQGRGGTLQLTYRAGSLDVTDLLTVETAPSNVGGLHWYCRCPMCERRCRKLYLPPREAYFLCRECGALTYRSSQESRQGESLHRLIAVQLGTTTEAVRRALGRR